MVKVVENNERICTVNLDGSECSIVFQSHYKYFTVKNESGSKVYISLKRDIVPEADGVMTVNSKESATITNMQPNVNMFFASGSGKIQVFASNSDNFVNPFKSAPAQSGGGVNTNNYDLGYTQIALGFLNGGGAYNGSNDWEKNRLAITQNYNNYNIMHSYAIDFTNVKTIIISGAVTSNLVGLTASGYCKISAEIETKLNADEWIKLATAVPETAYDLLNFTAEIDCTAITGEKYINLAIWHGIESNSYTVYLYVDRVEFIYGR